jgi:hypothetical protein
MALPFITASGVFKRRSMELIISYSGIVSIDLDHVNTDLKYELFEDSFLNPKLIFVSPSNTGLKLFIKVKNSSAEHHDHYFNAISVYLQCRYELKPYSACRDITRACFLCHDPEALYSCTGFVDSETLLNMIPPAPCTDEQLLITPRKDLPRYYFLHRLFTPSANQPVSTLVSADFKAAATPATAAVTAAVTANYLAYISSKLNTCPRVHIRAISILKQNGWTRKGKYWTRPGKSPEEGHSALFTRFAPYGIFLFTNFSENAPPFSPNKSYSYCMVIATLAYNGDYMKCIDELAQRYRL